MKMRSRRGERWKRAEGGGREEAKERRIRERDEGSGSQSEERRGKVKHTLADSRIIVTIWLKSGGWSSCLRESLVQILITQMRRVEEKGGTQKGEV